jgi:hypothetical protein
MDRLKARRCTSLFAGVSVLFVSACTEAPLPVELTDDAVPVVVRTPDVNWTGNGAPGGFCPIAASSSTRTWTFTLTTPDATTSTMTATFHEGEVTVPATLTAFFDNNIVLTARVAGPSGDLVSAEILDPGVPFQPLTVSWVGTRLSVTLATDGVGRLSSTASHLVGAINSHPGSLLTASLAAGSNGSGIVQPHAEAHLAGGSGGSVAALTATSGDDVRFTAVAAGSAGNAVSVTIFDPGTPNAPLTVAVIGSALVVGLGTDAAGVATSTVQQMVAAISAHPTSPASASVLAGTGTAPAGMLAQTSLAGGGLQQLINQYQVAGVKHGGGRSPFGFVLTTVADAQLLSASATGGSGTSKLTVASCD